MKHLKFRMRTPDGYKLFGQGWRPDKKIRGVICLCHGLGEHSGRYIHLARFLTESGFALITFDMRGHGKSPGKRGHAFSYEVLLDDITQLMREAKDRFPGIPLFLYGYSLGGNLVLNYALRRRPEIAGVIAASPFLRLSKRPFLLMIMAARIFNVLWPSCSISRKEDMKGITHDRKILADMDKDTLHHDHISARLFIHTYDAAAWAMEKASDFSHPLLLMHGSDDKYTSPQGSEDFAKLVKGDCTFKLWKGLYHELHNESKREDVFEYLGKWLKKHLKKGDTKHGTLKK